MKLGPSAPVTSAGSGPAEGLAERLRARLRGLGFDAVRYARVEPAFGPSFAAWLAAGQHGEMAWLERGAAKRADPELVLPGARTLIALGVN
jgi:epoxyqueuosine reductase